MNRADRARRNGEIVAAVEMGEPVLQVATRHCVSERTVRLVRKRWRDGELEVHEGSEREALTLEPAVARAFLVRLFAHHREAERRMDERIDRAEDDADRLRLLLTKVETLGSTAPLVAAIAALAGPVEYPHREPDLDWLPEINGAVRSALEAHDVADGAVSAAVESVVQWFADQTGRWELLGVPRPDC